MWWLHPDPVHYSDRRGWWRRPRRLGWWWWRRLEEVVVVEALADSAVGVDLVAVVAGRAGDEKSEP